MASFRHIAVVLAVGMMVPAVAGQVALRNIAIKTEPGAVIWIDGVRYGNADQNGRFEVKNLSGRVQLRVRADGFKEARKAILPTVRELEVPLVKTSDEAEIAYQNAERLAGLDRERSIAAYREAIKLKPSYVEAHIGLARVLSDHGDFEAANRAIKEAIRLRPRDAEAQAVDGRIQKLSGDETRAIAAFKRAITFGGGTQPEAYTGLGMLYQERAEAAASDGDFTLEARNYLEAEKNFLSATKQLGTSPDAAVVYQLLGLVYEKQKKYKEAIALYERFLKLFPDSPEATAVESFIVQLRKQMADEN